MSAQYSPWNIGPSDPNSDPLPMVPVPDYGTNPYSVTSQSQLTQAQNANNQNLQGLESQLSNYNQQSSYPAYPNPYGLGSPVGQEQQAKNPNPAAQGQGFNPWSLVGESNAR